MTRKIANPNFEEWLSEIGPVFKNPNTGREVLFKSLPAEIQAKKRPELKEKFTSLTKEVTEEVKKSPTLSLLWETDSLKGVSAEALRQVSEYVSLRDLKIGDSEDIEAVLEDDHFSDTNYNEFKSMSAIDAADLLHKTIKSIEEDEESGVAKKHLKGLKGSYTKLMSSLHNEIKNQVSLQKQASRVASRYLKSTHL